MLVYYFVSNVRRYINQRLISLIFSTEVLMSYGRFPRVIKYQYSLLGLYNVLDVTTTVTSTLAITHCPKYKVVFPLDSAFCLRPRNVETDCTIIISVASKTTLQSNTGEVR